MVFILVGMVVVGRRENRIQKEAEYTASRALPSIGKIAEKRHSQRFGRAATDAPGPVSWYPEVSKKLTKHA